MKWLAAVLLVLIVLLQYRLWLSPDGLHELTHLQAALAKQQSENSGLHERNQQLAAEVADLKSGLTAIEERARTDLGMISTNETFFQVVAPAAPALGGQAETRTAAAR